MNPAATNAVIAALESAKGLGENSVFEKIGSLDPDSISFGAEDIHSLTLAGKDFWNRHVSSIKASICNKDEITQVSSLGGKPLVDAVLGTLSTQFGEALAVYLAVLVIRRVLEGWCTSSAPDQVA